MMPRLLTKVPGILYGGDYNPEQWPEEVWLEDMRLMKQAGVNLVSIAIFGWSRLQSDETTYTFDWLDRLMALLAEHRIYADLATATATPPPWMSRYPDLAAVDENGCAYSHGSRQHYSPSSPTYRRFAGELVRRLARRYANHPALAAWHINNEYACHVSACHSEASTEAFRVWLQKRYGTLDALNAAWNTAFWSQAYYDWADVRTPRRTPTFVNPTQLLDFQRFSNEALLDLCKMEREILREETPDVPVTTNFMSFFKPLDQWAWSRELDFASWDSYPDFLPGEEPWHSAAQGHDLTRSLKPDRPFVLMEHATSHVHWRTVNPTKLPGQIRLYGLQAVARGADGALFFQWRQSLAGAEKYHGAMVQHGAPPEKSRVFREVCELGADLKKLAPVAGSLCRARVAIVLDWPTWWALEMPGKPTRFDYVPALTAMHRYFYQRNIAVDFVAPDANLPGYALVVAPLLYVIERATAENLTRYVREGGTLLTTCFSGIVDGRDHVVPGGYPAYLREVLGLWVEEWFALGPTERRAVKFGNDGRVLSGRHWSEVVHLEGAGALASYGDGPFAGSPAFTRHRFHQGLAFYLSTVLEGDDLAGALDVVTAPLDLKSPLAAPAGMEVTLRESDRQRFLFLLNHTDRPQTVPLGELYGTELLSGTPASGEWCLAAHGVAVIEMVR